MYSKKHISAFISAFYSDSLKVIPWSQMIFLSLSISLNVILKECICRYGTSSTSGIRRKTEINEKKEAKRKKVFITLVMSKWQLLFVVVCIKY